MSRKKRITGILKNTLDSLVSRYADCDGYWFYGFLVKKKAFQKYEILHSKKNNVGIKNRYINYCQSVILDQFLKRGLRVSNFIESNIILSRNKVSKHILINGIKTTGKDVHFRLELISKDGNIYYCETCITIARHNSLLERRSTRWDEEYSIDPSGQELIKILNKIMYHLGRSIDSEWSPISVNDLSSSIQLEIRKLETNRKINKKQLLLEFLPTSSLQEISMTNNWTDEYLILSSQFDHLIKTVK